jgi:uncharacterized protein (TIGR00255 family)
MTAASKPRRQAQPPSPVQVRQAEPASAAQIRSMTGYGRVMGQGDQAGLVAEVRSVNGRFFKLNLKLPPALGALEERVRKLLTECGAARGSVEVYLEAGEGEENRAFEISGKAVKAYLAQIKRISKGAKIPAQCRWEALLGLPGTVLRRSAGPDPEQFWGRCEGVLREAYAQFDRMRVAEGQALAQDVLGRLAELREHQRALAEGAPAAREEAVQRLRTRLAQWIDPSLLKEALRPESMEREVVLLLDRMDVSEELARLASHFQQMERTLAEGGEVGKKLDFMTQELFREVNTIGSKSQNDAITHRVVEMKNIVEKIREQVQNLI